MLITVVLNAGADRAALKILAPKGALQERGAPTWSEVVVIVLHYPRQQ